MISLLVALVVGVGGYAISHVVRGRLDRLVHAALGVVDQILDVVEENISIRHRIDRDGVLGAAVVGVPAEIVREAVARRFRVSLGMVKKLLQQRRRTGDVRPQHHRSGRKQIGRAHV